MPWVRFDDQFPIHRKVDGLSDAAFRLHTSAIFWSARNLTDGSVTREDLDGVSARVRTPERFAAECKKRGVWHLGDEDCPSEKCPADGEGDPDGWIIHDYWEFQPSKAQVVADRQAAAKRQAKWRASHNGGSNGVTNGVSASSPSRPPLKGGGASARATREGADARPPPLATDDQHPFKPDPNGTCETCGLPESNRHHLEAP
jgi:hypothetical protein